MGYGRPGLSLAYEGIGRVRQRKCPLLGALMRKLRAQTTALRIDQTDVSSTEQMGALIMIAMLLLIASAPEISAQNAVFTSARETCRQFEVAGSRIPEKVCATEAQWLQYDDYKRQREILSEKTGHRSRPMGRF